MEFNEVYSNYKDFVYGVVNKILRYNNEEIKDLCQEIWILIFRKLHQFDESKGIIEGWLYRIASNHVFRYFKKQDSQIKTYLVEDFTFNISCSPDVFRTEKEFLEYQKIEVVKNAVSKLQKGQKEIFNLYYFEGLKHDEIAEIKELSPNTSKTQLIRARARIQELIK